MSLLIANALPPVTLSPPVESPPAVVIEAFTLPVTDNSPALAAEN